jgi:5-methylcytosine-specific restriction endonuclease McrA
MAGIVTDWRPYPKSRQLSRGERRYRRKVASPKQWQAIRADKCTGPCRVCGIGAPAGGHDAHHLVARDHFGDDVPANIVGLCRDCHRGVELREPAHCRLMLTRLADDEYAYMVDRGGEDYPERAYGITFDTATRSEAHRG